MTELAINWQHLRSLNNSQNTAFEELCCQLAAYESAPPRSRFVRKAAPDAGLECYWTLPSGDEWGWQAKFFLSRPGDTQWAQIDDSVNTALEKHPRLTIFTLCLPIDRQDPRLEDQFWFMDQWKIRAKKWQQWADGKSMSVDFAYWGQHEILERLGREEHRGRYFFWFNKEHFSDQWFQNHVAEAISNAGPRYTPELNVELPVSKLFEGLARTRAFGQRLRSLLIRISQGYSKASNASARKHAAAQYTLLDNLMEQLRIHLQVLDNELLRQIEFETISEVASKLRDAAWETSRILENAANSQPSSSTAEDASGRIATNKPDFGYTRHHLNEIALKTLELSEFVTTPECTIANVPALLMTGDAGTGKSHLFCDVAKNRIANGLPTLLLLGEQFETTEPWQQISQMLSVEATKDELLGSLEAAAQSRGARALILIDALNEGEGKKLWHKYLAGMLTTVSRYPWVGIALSVRSSYQQTVIPRGVVPTRLIQVEHRGFAEHEYEASAAFFEHYGIKAPSVPLLNPEFQNPMFLKLFCRGLKNRGLTEVPVGLEGITAIFKFFIDSVNEILAAETRLNYDEKAGLIDKVVNALIEALGAREKTWLPREEAQEMIDAFLPREGYQNSLFRNLIVEGVLSEDRFLSDDGTWLEGVRFSYERLSDHLVVKTLLDKHLDVANPQAAFAPDQPLASFLKDENTCWYNQGIVEALSIQIPERTSKELGDCAPAAAVWGPVLNAFVESVMWREPRAITDGTLKYINDHVLKFKEHHDDLYDALLTVASNSRHPLNADFLHKHLLKFGLADRDAWWNIFLHEEYRYKEHSAVDRLINWAWSDSDKRHIDDESIRLAAVALGWFLTSSNRFLRDRATKALVCLLGPRIETLRHVLTQFNGVNDPYVSERLYAVAYGCAMRSNDNEGIANLARDIYDTIFSAGCPPAHLTLRDYARGVIEAALHNDGDLDIQVERIRPPYKSKWPDQIPSKEDLQKYKEIGPAIYHSVMGFGDFARYVVGTNSYTSDWTSQRLGQATQPTHKEIYEAFVNSLTKRQKAAWEAYQNVRKNIETYREMEDTKRLEVFKANLTDDELSSLKKLFEERLRKSLGRRKSKTFSEYVIPYLEHPTKYYEEHRFDLSILQRWIVWRVFDLGWTPEKFSDFDNSVTRWEYHGRTAHKPERMGKKYQWIAYHEILARLADNFVFKGDTWSGHPEKYEGPWQVFNRDIDPSCLLKKTAHGNWDDDQYSWWFTTAFDNWGEDVTAEDWVKRTDNLPGGDKLIGVSNPKDGSEWLTLDAYYSWKPPVLPGEERVGETQRTLWYFLKAYLVKESDLEHVFEWAKTQKFTAHVMPEARDLYEVFLGEFYWAPAYQYHNVPYFNHPGWDRGHNDQVPKEVLVLAEGYKNEASGTDCSVDDGYVIKLPNKLIVDDMDLSWNGTEGHFFNKEGKLVAFDPSVRGAGPRALLIRRNEFLDYLNKHGYGVLWTVYGEKYDYSDHPGDKRWAGRLEITGAYRVRDGEIEGDTRIELTD